MSNQISTSWFYLGSLRSIRSCWSILYFQPFVVCHTYCRGPSGQKVRTLEDSGTFFNTIVCTETGVLIPPKGSMNIRCSESGPKIGLNIFRRMKLQKNVRKFVKTSTISSTATTSTTTATTVTTTTSGFVHESCGRINTGLRTVSHCSGKQCIFSCLDEESIPRKSFKIFNKISFALESKFFLRQQDGSWNRW